MVPRADRRKGPLRGLCLGKDPESAIRKRNSDGPELMESWGPRKGPGGLSVSDADVAALEDQGRRSGSQSGGFPQSGDPGLHGNEGGAGPPSEESGEGGWSPSFFEVVWHLPIQAWGATPPPTPCLPPGGDGWLGGGQLGGQGRHVGTLTRRVSVRANGTH